MNSDWETIRIESSPIQIIDGDRGANYPKQEEFFEDEYCVFLNTSNVTKQGFNFSKTQFITKEKDILLRKGKLKRFDIVLTTRGTVGNIAYYNENIPYENIRINSGMVIFRNSNSDVVSTKYFYQFLKSNLFLDQVCSFSSGSAQPQLPIGDLKLIEFPIPPLQTQHRIAEILSALDDKIELNRQTNATLEAVAQAIFKEWFVNFNFPSATGELVESKLGLIPRGWRGGMLEEIITNFDRKRVPLSSRERESRKGVFPYYGAASILDYVDDYLFDGVYLLMGEDGTVMTEDERPILQYVSGKFWVNNHTHVLQGKYPFSTEYVLLQLKNTNVKHIVTGAVQPKINQGNMNELPVIIPDDFTLVSFQDIITPIFKNLLETEQETFVLAGIRDNLLPKLMNGEVLV